MEETNSKEPVHGMAGRKQREELREEGKTQNLLGHMQSDAFLPLDFTNQITFMYKLVH